MTGLTNLLRMVVCAGLAVALAACDSGGPSAAAQDWTAPGVLIVIHKNDRLYLANVLMSPRSVRTLADLPASASTGVLTESAIVGAGPTQSLVLVSDGSGFGATVIKVDASARSTSAIGRVPAGRFPSLAAGVLSGVEVLDGVKPFVRSYILPGLALQSSIALGFVPVAAGGDCMVGSSTNVSQRGILFARLGDAQPRMLVPETAPGGVACSGELAVVSVAAHDPSGVANADRNQLVPDNRLAIVRGAGAPTTVAVGVDPEAVAIVNPSLAAVEVEGKSSRAVVFVDLGTGKVVRTVTLLGFSRVVSMTARGDELVVLGESAVALVPVSGGDAAYLNLSGSTDTYELLPAA